MKTYKQTYYIVVNNSGYPFFDDECETKLFNTKADAQLAMKRSKLINGADDEIFKNIKYKKCVLTY